MSSDRISGVQRAAVLLMCLGEDTTARVFNQLTDEEIQRIAWSMTAIDHIPLSMKNSVLQRFIEDQHKSEGLFISGDEFARNSIIASHSKERTESLLNQHLSVESKPLGMLSAINPQLVADIIQGEHPQTIALILSTQDSSYASEVVSLLPDEMQADIIYRIAKLEHVSQEVLETLEAYLLEEIGKMGHGTQQEIAGFDQAVKLLSKMKHTLNTTILGKLEETDNELVQKIKKKMFTFEALGDLDDRILQSILRRINKDSLALALKTASDELKQRFFSNMSPRAAEMIRDDLEALGPMRLSDVEAMQQAIVKTAMRLQEESALSADHASDHVIS
ncbi:MAG: flagellar motor switch protein FliG [Desulfofustis sp.]|nr:flagellar motor switch protein FliG [Desulfofustis sp.]RZW17595.1 MAG: flagellar motor switch protein FliG [Desulfobulbaceae bacterium]